MYGIEEERPEGPVRPSPVHPWFTPQPYKPPPEPDITPGVPFEVDPDFPGLPDPFDPTPFFTPLDVPLDPGIYKPFGPGGPGVPMDPRLIPFMPKSPFPFRIPKSIPIDPNNPFDIPGPSETEPPDWWPDDIPWPDNNPLEIPIDIPNFPWDDPDENPYAPFNPFDPEHVDPLGDHDDDGRPNYLDPQNPYYFPPGDPDPPEEPEDPEPAQMPVRGGQLDRLGATPNQPKLTSDFSVPNVEGELAKRAAQAMSRQNKNGMMRGGY
tara:strand:+ start:793 stop:1587 length:795 start_codon:yes stop_codon:yes gene_type:complete